MGQIGHEWLLFLFSYLYQLVKTKLIRRNCNHFAIFCRNLIIATEFLLPNLFTFIWWFFAVWNYDYTRWFTTSKNLQKKIIKQYVHSFKIRLKISCNETMKLRFNCNERIKLRFNCNQRMKLRFNCTEGMKLWPKLKMILTIYIEVNLNQAEILHIRLVGHKPKTLFGFFFL